MIIRTDEEGNQAIVQLCDIALKTGGIKNLEAINSIIKGITIIQKQVPRQPLPDERPIGLPESVLPELKPDS